MYGHVPSTLRPVTNLHIHTLWAVLPRIWHGLNLWAWTWRGESRSFGVFFDPAVLTAEEDEERRKRWGKNKTQPSCMNRPAFASGYLSHAFAAAGFKENILVMNETELARPGNSRTIPPWKVISKEDIYLIWLTFYSWIMLLKWNKMSALLVNKTLQLVKLANYQIKEHHLTTNGAATQNTGFSLAPPLLQYHIPAWKKNKTKLVFVRDGVCAQYCCGCHNPKLPLVWKPKTAIRECLPA